MSATPNIEALPLVDDDSGEDWLRVAINTSSLRPEDLPKIGTAYKDTSLHTANGRMDLFQDYLLRKYTNGPDSIRFAHFLKAKTEDEALTPYKSIPDNEHFEWPQVIKSWVRAQDPSVTITRTRPGGTTYKVPKDFALIVGYPQTFRSCRIVTDYFLSDTPFNIPEHAYPDPSPLEWILNGSPDSINGLHPEMLLPRGTGSINTVEIQGDTTTYNPTLGNLRHFPATLMKDWASFILRDKQEETEAGHYRRIRTRIFPPKRPPLQSL